MTGYIKSSIDFSKIQNTVDAAKNLDAAGQTEQAKKILNTMAEALKEESK